MCITKYDKQTKTNESKQCDYCILFLCSMFYLFQNLIQKAKYVYSFYTENSILLLCTSTHSTAAELYTNIYEQYAKQL